MPEVTEKYVTRIDQLTRELASRSHHILEAMPIMNERQRLHDELAEIFRLCRPWNYVPATTTPR